MRYHVSSVKIPRKGEPQLRDGEDSPPFKIHRMKLDETPLWIGGPNYKSLEEARQAAAEMEKAWQENSVIFEQARTEVKRLGGHVVVDAAQQFMVRKKMSVRTRKGARGFVSITGLIDDFQGYIFFIQAGFLFPNTGAVPAALTLGNTTDIKQALIIAKNKSLVRTMRGFVQACS